MHFIMHIMAWLPRRACVITLQSVETLFTERKMWLQPVWIVLVALLCDKVRGGPAEPSAGKFWRKVSVYTKGSWLIPYRLMHRWRRAASDWFPGR